MGQPPRRGQQHGSTVMKTCYYELLGCAKTERCMAYWVARPSVTERMTELTGSGALERGETVVVCLISDTLWKLSDSAPTLADAPMGQPEHWVRVRAVRDVGGGMLDVAVFSFGEVQTRILSAGAWGRCYFEAIFAELNEP